MTRRNSKFQSVCFHFFFFFFFFMNGVTSLPWPHRQMYSFIRQKGGRTSSKSPRRRVAKIPEFQKDNYNSVQSKMRGQ